MRPPSAQIILAEIDKRMLALQNRARRSAKADSPEYNEILGGLAELEAVRDMIAYRRHTLSTNSTKNPAQLSDVPAL